jgi:riboflavin synthase
MLSIVHAQNSLRFSIGCSKVLEDIKLGDSIAVDGVCLTVNSFDGKSFSSDVMPETIRRSSFHLLHTGSNVNLERAMCLKDRFGGHIVTGHIDGTATLHTRYQEGNALVCVFRSSAKIIQGIVEKGSVAIDGISLTVMNVNYKAESPFDGGTFSVSIIPHTQTHTMLGEKRIGSIVNIECDILGKYISQYKGYANGKE